MVLPSKRGGIDAMNPRRCLSQSLEPLRLVSRFENDFALEP
jgi:hypothetical protein